ncbi:adenylyltransferase/cytidyltransferase family protein [Piscirickettsia salmonis]|uniref:adenylyltransferase/cytidyltransferase family protein n=1 Tax=Piscirickettsia salmonis TaxID=1238 RepID=UPI0002F3F6C7|nr:adenylyltransferase/cytidyltransferase family protein [Piscirickettsia salmonis]APS57651.1 glycerol-3-phosphate cytidylyltransferase [Piscirickettsia salmonis]ERL63255.1 glycerol-3-phosphate cytidylyltransferase [Piscirickettsia salmonis LF-89 = ATCC VR-1361]PEQ17392.1 glycerol-3-phosphate cytidylyltransferase [Piscirickettsia salmonis]QGN75936.1 Glycerol-3-phosphate cytidylyltransferase [Piscirickettsia salmonis]QGN79500.1 Glycerol-3-phosphate cytidylyltransferase [Piscirickettsia salmonis
MKVVVTFGTFDLFHYGHLRILERARALGDKLIVGVSSDALNYNKKQCYPITPQEQRLSIVLANKFVDDVFYEESLELKREYLIRYKANTLVMGDDWKGCFDFCKNLCEVVYLPRTKDISTTDLKAKIKALEFALS